MKKIAIASLTLVLVLLLTGLYAQNGEQKGKTEQAPPAGAAPGAANLPPGHPSVNGMNAPGAMPPGHPNVPGMGGAMGNQQQMMQRQQEMMQRYQTMLNDVRAMQERLDKKAAAMNAAKGEDKIKAITDVINELVDQRRTETQRMIDAQSRMVERMNSMNMMRNMNDHATTGTLPGPRPQRTAKPAPKGD